MEKIKIGKVVNVVGLKGEMKVYSYAETPERFEKLTHLFLGEEVFTLESVRCKGTTPIIKVRGIEDRTAAEVQRNREVYMFAADPEPLPPGQHYIKDLLGFAVITTDGTSLGTLQEISTQGAQKLYRVETPEGKMIYIPGVPAFILEKNVAEKIIKVTLPDGLLEL